MVHIIKVYFKDQNKEKQIRRLAVSSETVGSYNLLASKIKDIFPALASTNFDLTWRDSENDVIHMSSDDELAQALANAEEGLLRLGVSTSDNQEPKIEEFPKVKSSHNEIHPSVICDACDANVCGYRYKCLQCRNYDLCSACNAADKHGHHDMIKLVTPAHIHREWVFLGARKMWRSMFGRCPSAFFKNCQQQKGDQTPQEEKPTNGKAQWHTVVDDLLKGDFVPAEKVLKENLGNFLNFVESVAGGVDVKIEHGPCPTGPNPNWHAHAKHFFKSAEEKASTQTEQSTASTPCKEEAHSIPKNVEPVVEKEKADVKSDAPVVSEASSHTSDSTTMADVDSSVINVDKVPETKVKESSPSPCGLFAEVETSLNADGWTLVHEQEAEKKESSSAAASGDSGAIPKKSAMYPDITETVECCKIPEKQLNVDKAQEETKPKETAPVSQDPEIMNALVKMQAMGFTNEGGWLERLLITKDGNINAALDALYPNTRRH